MENVVLPPYYYAVIGNRDHIKRQGRKTPIWEFMDTLPGGWLTSLAYVCKELPDGAYRRPMIFDCGAWSYKKSNDSVPCLGKTPVTPQWAWHEYQRLASSGDIVIAPDHMLIPGFGIPGERRKFNERSAMGFHALACGSCLRPMAVVHGATAAERVEASKRYAEMGYRFLAVGGVAGQASNKRMAVDAVACVRAAVPGIHLHVLGLSAPSYVAEWKRLGIESFDGSSHFKQAFAGGAFFTRSGSSLVKHQAVRPGEDADHLPLCDCKACALLRAEGIDTRSYGSNENNMGRAVHNLNILMACHAETIPATTPPVLYLNLALFGEEEIQ